MEKFLDIMASAFGWIIFPGYIVFLVFIVIEVIMVPFIIIKSIIKAVEAKLESKSSGQGAKAAGMSRKSIYDIPRGTELANLCKMGDITAMRDMAYFFRDSCEKKVQELLDAYELNPVKENEDLIDKYLRGKERTRAQAYMMWLVRAAVYGNDEAAVLIDKCPYYKKNSYIPYDVLTGNTAFVWESDELWEIGIIDMVRGRTDCRLWLCRDKGCYEFMYVDSYYPADEDGFGAEWEYESAYYNEFFCRIAANDEKDVSPQLFISEQTRNWYWEEPKHNASERKYQRRFCSQG